MKKNFILWLIVVSLLVFIGTFNGNLVWVLCCVLFLSVFFGMHSINVGIKFKQIVFEAYVKKDSWIYSLSNKHYYIVVVSAFVAFVGASIEYLYLYSLQWYFIIIVLSPLIFLKPIKELFERYGKSHFNENILFIMVSVLSISVVASIICLMMVLVKYIESWTINMVAQNSDGIATMVIETVNHNCKIVQDILRTQKMFEFELLRIREIGGLGIIGEAIYAYFLLPAVLPASVITTTMYSLLTLSDKVDRWIK